ncbi:hypothetical protein CRT60_12700 [Azospirillum palustre]|uniref:Uncharacterized protein n=1 Tax=Azospirillum palustre TaxID=2044885 RepID=A0A2B8BJA6_9PROT|nr:hypothetical protein CRT60_12700 [Azospirillum palustre]
MHASPCGTAETEPRERTSGAYLGAACFVMSTPASQETGPPRNPERFTARNAPAGAPRGPSPWWRHSPPPSTAAGSPTA